MSDHKGHGLLTDGLRREDEVALVLAVAVVGDDDRSPVPHLL
jgi:hypothetical protein